MENFRAKVMFTATTIFNNLKCTWGKALKKAWQLYRLKKAMHSGIVKFCYEKVDGSARIAYGTLFNLPERKRSAKKEPSYKTICYFDTKKQAFRSFKVENFIAVCA